MSKERATNRAVEAAGSRMEPVFYALLELPGQGGTTAFHDKSFDCFCL